MILLTTPLTHCASRLCVGISIAHGTDISFFKYLPHTLQLGPEVWRVLAKCHDVRNLGEYEGNLDIDERLVADLITACHSVAQKLKTLTPL